MLQKIIPSYLYLEYSDDSDLQAFVRAYNEMAQENLDSFNNLNLPIYTQFQIQGALLDWVAEGLYGLKRPSFGVFKNLYAGTLNTWLCNTTMPNEHVKIVPVKINDDVFKRMITWHFFKGDGKVFSIAWLKRRIERFLFGANGSDYNGSDSRYRISVSFLNENTVVIRIINKILTITSGTIPNLFKPNQLLTLNSVAFSIVDLVKIPMADMLKRGIESGFLELPFQFNYVVVNE